MTVFPGDLLITAAGCALIILCILTITRKISRTNQSWEFDFSLVL